ncbi:MAG: DUF2330 domain-containing protein, partial [Myxococcales bacterium]|nr:DUF2330 domain-containing protein [Myxococcales bacterium]
PLRFHYDSESFELPVRLGLLNAHGKQDLIVHILSKGKRYEVANYDNVTIPTNIDVSEATKSRFGAFYASLFDEVVAKHPRSVITEYAWQATSCDPCPGPPLGGKDFMTLGGDVLAPMPDDQPFPSGPPRRPGRGRMWGGGSQYVLTRLHARYDRNALNEDLVFREAPPIVGGREFLQEGGKLERGATPSSVNNFQGRYIIRHPWTGPITCAQPRRGRWGGPPGGAQPPTMPAQKLAFAPRGVALASFTEANPTADGMSLLSKGTPLGNTTPLPPAPEPDTTPAATGTASEPAPGDATSVPATPPSSGGCGGCSVGSADDARDFAWGALLALGLATWRRRRR